MATRRTNARKIPPRERRKPKKRWTREDVIRELQDRHQRGLDVINVKRQDRRLIRGVMRFFDRWRDALVTAGIVSSNGKRRRNR
jgi:hypothetical protein